MQFIVNTKQADLSTACDQPLIRAVFISLFAWRRANDDDDVQDGDRQGWWGDTYAEDAGDLTGSRLWELLRQKVTAQTLLQAQEFAEEALQWLIDDAVARSVRVTAESSERGRVDMSVVITKPDSTQISIRFQDCWEAL